jgi:hypothetical protein
MARRVKIKSKVVKDTLKNKDVLEMFHGVLGTSEGGATLSVTHPKYQKIEAHVGRFLKLLDLVCGSDLLALFPEPHARLAEYVASLRAQRDASFAAPDLDRYVTGPETTAGGGKIGLATVEGYSRVPPEVAAAFAAVFAEIKKCTVVNVAIVTCKNLVSFKKYLKSKDSLRDKFLRGAGTTLAPLPDLPQLNFKQIYIDDRLTPDDREFVLVVLHKLYVIGHDVYEAVSAPDIDVNEFVEVIMASIGEVRKHIPRCDAAFDKIGESVDLLRGNFGDYYKDYVASNNPTIIMEHFVSDVAKNTKSSATVTGQFRQIIRHYKKLASQQATTPQLQGLFNQVDNNFQELERRSQEADARGDDESSSDEDGVADAGGSGEPGDSGSPSPAPAGEARAAAAPFSTTASTPTPAPTTTAAPAAVPQPEPGRKRRRRGRGPGRPRGSAAARGAPLSDSQESLADELDRDFAVSDNQ